MVMMATPSPTPSADGVQPSSNLKPNTSHPVGDFTMCELINGQTSYGLPPREDPYGQNCLREGSASQHLTSWHMSQTLPMRTRAATQGLRNTTPQRNDDSDWTPSPPTRASRRSTTKSKKKEKGLIYSDLEVPLSVWGANNKVNPLPIEDYANKTSEERKAKAMEDGYIKRSLNPYFMYKYAYLRVAKAWMLKHHPNQAKTQPPLVTLIGESWKKESGAFKEPYYEYAKKDSDALKKAFPDYKYKPNVKRTPAVEDQPRTPDRQDEAFPQNFRDAYERRVRRSGPGVFNDELMDFPDYSNHYPTPQPVYMAHNAGPMITDQADAFLQPGRPGWAHGLNSMRGRSISPAPSQMSYDAMDHVPIDPSLLDGGFSDYVPSRAVSEEPCFIAPSQIHHSSAPSPMPMRQYHNEPNMSEFFSDPAPSRCQSEEPLPRGGPWPDMPDAVLSSLPTNNSHPIDNPIDSDHFWQLDNLDENEPLPGFSWDAADDWEHNFEDDNLLHI